MNGELKSLEHIEEHLKMVDGVMVGRAVYDNPYLLAQLINIYMEIRVLWSHEKIF